MFLHSFIIHFCYKYTCAACNNRKKKTDCRKEITQRTINANDNDFYRKDELTYENIF